VILGTILDKDDHPGGFQTFLLNFTALSVSYNGAWWFLTTYLLFVISSSFWFRLLLKWNSFIYLVVLFVLYGIGFYFRIYNTALFTSPFLKWLHVQSALYFCTLFQFMLGALALQYRLHSKVSAKMENIPFKNYFLVFGIILLVAVHGVIPNFFIAPFIAFIFIFFYCQLKIPLFFQKAIDFFTPHATNIWLIHMFFYMIYFKEFVYSFTYVIPIFMVLVIMSVAGSFIINFFLNKIHSYI
jgi:hypothetical protein